MKSPFYILLSYFLFSIGLNAAPHWECIPNSDVIEYADCVSDDGKKIRVTSLEELGNNFTLNATFPSGSFFSGRASNGVFFGKRIDPSGLIIEAPLDGYFFNGKGTIIYPEDTDHDYKRYEGEINIDSPNGKGKMYFKERSPWDYMEGIFEYGNHISGTTFKSLEVVKSIMDLGLILKRLLFDGGFVPCDSSLTLRHRIDHLLLRFHRFSNNLLLPGHRCVEKGLLHITLGIDLCFCRGT